MKILNFKSENLVVDWISFNVKGFIDSKLIARYFFQRFNFNSTISTNQDRKKNYLFYDKKNQYQVSFIQHQYNPESKNFWIGTQIYFSGKNATYFYSFIQKHQFDWNVFDKQKISLGRFDLCYFREIKINDQTEQLEIFLSNCMSKLVKKSKKNNINYDRGTKGYILRIGNRKSSNFYRIYQTENGLRFELEIKKKQIQQFSELLLVNRIEEFEEKLIKHFYMYSKKVLTLNDYYTDWLINYFRKTDKPINSLVTSYFRKQNTKNLSKKVNIFIFLQFLAFSRSKKFNSIEIYDQTYYLIEFYLKEFIQFSGIKNINQYQRNKFITFFYSFQKIEPFITSFSDSHFQSLLAFPYIDIQKQANLWTVKIAVSKLLYDYSYPFAFPNTFLTYQNLYDLQVKLQIIELISTVSLEKVFYVQIFIEQFKVPTQKKTQIKKYIVEIFHQLQVFGLIKKNYTLVKKSGQIKQVDTLTHLLVGQVSRIHFYENI
jgi:hypothetical protein